ncbi:MAG: hypothetical protein JXA60_02645 [Candidatus Coatesbacteria bacterium]|nr:hypothetical protein [Candidatus Coatesbacteria bacterium]
MKNKGITLLASTIFLMICMFSCDNELADPDRYETSTGDSDSFKTNLVIITPPDSGAFAGYTYTVNWDYINVDTGKYLLNLYYDEDNNKEEYNGIIAENLDLRNKTFKWDISNVKPGYYYVLGILKPKTQSTNHELMIKEISRHCSFFMDEYDYSPGKLLITRNDAPVIEITHPDTGATEADIEFQIRWRSYDKEANKCLVDLYYDLDTNSTNGFIDKIAMEVPDTGSFLWDVYNLAESDYYIYGEIYDKDLGTRRRIHNNRISFGRSSDYSTGVVRVRHGSSSRIKILTPPAEGDYAKDFYEILWETYPAKYPEFLISLYYDTDQDQSNGVSGTIAELLPDTGMFRWNLASIARGNYFILGVLIEARTGKVREIINTRLKADFSYSDGMLYVVDNMPPTMTFIAPPEEGASASETYRLAWSAYDEESDPFNISLYYDLDTLSWNGLGDLIVENLKDVDYYDWDLTGVPCGVYYIVGVIDDSHYRAIVHSKGTLTVLPLK